MRDKGPHGTFYELSIHLKSNLVAKLGDCFGIVSAIGARSRGVTAKVFNPASQSHLGEELTRCLGLSQPQRWHACLVVGTVRLMSTRVTMYPISENPGIFTVLRWWSMVKLVQWPAQRNAKKVGLGQFRVTYGIP